MRPVNAAIRRHVKDAAAVTDIYNRAYEAVMEVQDALNVSAAVAYKQIAENAKNLQRAEAAEAQVAALQAELTRAIDIYKDPAVAHANILNGRIVLPKFYVNITDDFGPVADLRAALAAANEDAERLADKLSEVVAYGGYYADIENRMPPDGQTFKVIAVSLGGVDDFTVLRMDGKLYFASDPPREVPRGFEIIRIKPWDVKTFGKTEEEDF